MGNQLCEAKQQSPYKARVMELCNGVDEKEAKGKLEPITFSDQGSPRENAYRDDQVRENSIDQMTGTKQQFSPMLKDKPQVTPFTADKPQVTPFTADNIKQQPEITKNQKAMSYSQDYLSQSPTTKLAKFNLNQVYLKYMQSQHEQGNLDYKPITVPFSVIKMVLSKRLIPLIEQEKPKFFKQYQRDQHSFKLYKQGCYGCLLTDSSGIFLNNNYFYEGSFVLHERGEFMPDKMGTYVTEEGKYVGEFRLGKPHGKGRYVLFDGEDYNRRTVYAGEWDNGAMDKGAVENHLFKYQGELKHRKPHGQGQLLLKAAKTSYKGQFYQGKYHGERAFYETSQYTYSGDFANGKKHGRGVLSQKASALQAFSKKIRKEERYEGTWREDRLDERIVTEANG